MSWSSAPYSWPPADAKWHSLSGRPRYGGDLAAKAAKESRKWKAKAKLYTI